jgi:glycosyltransferase involved in cell wall biosynthesis
LTRICFYNPYADVLGGGEKYLLTIIEEATRRTEAEVVMMTPERPRPERWGRLRIEVDPSALRWRRAGHLSVTPKSLGADLFVAITNHVPPLSLARRSAVIVQFPYEDLRDAQGPLGRVRRAERRRRFASYQTIICYSQFVREHIAQRLGREDALVIEPPVDPPGAPPSLGREPKVVAVGRFFPARDANNKRHDLLIEAWRRLEIRTGGWELHLAGGLHDDLQSRAYLEELRRQAEGLDVHFHPNIPADALSDLYWKSSIFWHAAGHGENRPERQEHFGITTVEAMSRGCVPVVTASGGQPEVVSDGVDGRLWHTLEQLVSITAELIDSPSERERMSAAAQAGAKRFSKGVFLERVRQEVFAPAGIVADRS